MKWSTKIVNRGGVNFKRPRKPDGTLIQPTPCHECPKKSPAEAHLHQLSAKNVEAFNFSLRVKATNGAYLTEEMKADEVLINNLVIIDSIVRAHEMTLAMGGGLAGVGKVFGGSK